MDPEWVLLGERSARTLLRTSGVLEFLSFVRRPGDACGHECGEMEEVRIPLLEMLTGLPEPSAIVNVSALIRQSLLLYVTRTVEGTPGDEAARSVEGVRITPVDRLDRVADVCKSSTVVKNNKQSN